MALIEWSYYSNTLGMMTRVNIVTPMSMTRELEINQEREYPVLYLLHGMSDDHSVWLRRASVERFADEKDMIVIMPTTYLGWYTDTKHGMKYFSYIADELPDVLSRVFRFLPSKRERTFVAGNSMGGYGAFKFALSRPDRFVGAASLSGVMDIHYRLLEHAKIDPNPPYWEGIFGNFDDVKGSANDLMRLTEDMAKQKNRPDLYFCCGTEDFLYEANQRMRAHLDKLQYPYHYHEGPGAHTWDYWETEIQLVMDWIAEKTK